MPYIRVLVFALIMTAGCSPVGESYKRPEPTAGAVDIWNGRLDGAIRPEELDPKLLAKWWETLNDATLTMLIERATAANLDLRTASAQLRQVRAERNLSEAARSPTVDFGGSAQQSRGSGGNSQLYTVGLDARWEIDVFGGISRDIEAAEADLQAAEELRRDVLVTVLAEVALNYIDLHTATRRKTLTELNLASQQDYLNIVLDQEKAGAATRVDVDRASSNVETTRATIPTLNQQIRKIKNRLAVLVGKPPGGLDRDLVTLGPLPVKPGKIAVGVPAEVLRRRPDVRKAERELAAQTARVGVAIADLYPKFALVGSIGLESLSPTTWLSSFGPRVQWNVFDGGRIRQKIEIQNAIQEQALVEYERAILNALEDVENAITAFTQEQVRRESLNNSAQASARAAQIAVARYEAGDIDFLAVLDAQRARFNAQDQLAQVEGKIMSDLIRLYKALGGGWRSQ